MKEKQKMNPNEIKKALKCCVVKGVCEDCPYKPYRNSYECFGKILSDNLAYINQLEAEVDKYKATFEPMVNLMVEAKSEAIKEFAERLKAKVRMNCFCEKLVFESDIDSLVKEMVGEQNV